MPSGSGKKIYYAGIAVIFAALSAFSFIEAIANSPMDKSYAHKFDGLLSTSASYNSTTASLMHYNNLILAWTLIAIASLAMMILFMALYSFSAKKQ